MRKKHFITLTGRVIAIAIFAGTIACNTHPHAPSSKIAGTYDFGGRRISIKEANAMIGHYLHTADSNSTHAVFCNADTLRAFLSNPSIRGIKFFLASKDSLRRASEPSSLTLVIAGVDSAYRYVYTDDGGVYDETFPCPPECPPGAAQSDLLP